ncbi:MAG: SBBP repeat-containing protein, partial [Bacteroidota bacterium]|nr:SBBP repeat-containing protein [Bacteroidota bacterium]
WAKRFGSHDDDGATALACGAGGFVVTGSFADTVDFGGTPLRAQGSSDIFILKFTSEGSLVWARQAGGTANGEGAGIALDGFENVYVTGKFFDTVDIGGTPPDCDGIGNIYISKYTSDGVKQWVKCSGAGGEEGGAAIAIDRNENIYVTGGYDNLINLGAGDLLNNGLIDIFIAKYDPSGKAIWSDRAGEAGTDLGTAIATDRNSNLFLAGAFSDTCSFGPFLLESLRQTDGFVAKIALESSVHDPLSAVDLSVSIYPNPARSVLNVEYSIPSSHTAVTLEIINILGESVKKYISPHGKSSFTLTVDDLPAGVYCCRLSANGVSTSHTVVIQ